MTTSNTIDSAEWLTSSNEALYISLVRDPSKFASTSTTRPAGETQADEAEQDDEDDEDEVNESKRFAHEESSLVKAFHPEFTYPIFGDKEVIFGYKGLRIDLQLSSSSLHALLTISYKSKISSKATPADDVEGTLYKFLSSDYTKIPETFGDTVKTDLENFVPPGELFMKYSLADGLKGADGGDDFDFGIYKCNWKTPGFRALHRRMQLFILLYIEGGSYIQEDEDNWEFLILFERRKRAGEKTTYHFAGYVSAYPFWCYPDMVRMRLSQFVILPPYQGAGHGSQLYSALYSYILTLPQVSELTIEDPSEAFEDLRDRNDLKRLRKLLVLDPASKSGIGKGKGKGVEMGVIAKGAPVDKIWMEERRKEGKYAKRQFSRLLEMLLLQGLDKEDKDAYKAYRLHVKERLYRFNYEILSQLTPEERKQKLQETYDNVEQDYQRLLETLRPDGKEIWVSEMA